VACKWAARRWELEMVALELGSWLAAYKLELEMVALELNSLSAWARLDACKSVEAVERK
jgi:hypothetical protein